MAGRRTKTFVRAAISVAALFAAGCAVNVGERYRDYARFVSADGGLRDERSPADAPFSNDDLLINFEKIALNREYRRENGELIEERTPTRVSRWTGPVRYRLIGDGATAQDAADYRDLAQRLSDLTGLEVSEAAGPGAGPAPNVVIRILGPKGRRDFINQLEEEGAADRMPLIVEWADDIRYPCVGQIGYIDSARGRITGALIVIKAELEGLFRKSCIHEELIQSLGLLNDDDDVRPSIFNDDQEFALMTEHDELLLRVLYDNRLSPGMSAEEALPIVPEIIAELRPE